jgi:ferritin
VKEQTEEENLTFSFLDKIKIAGSEKATRDILYLLDIDLANTPDGGRLAEEVII